MIEISFLFLNENFSILLLSIVTMFEFKRSPLEVLNTTFNVQNSSGLNNSISCSLSVNNLNATDWTLPADFDPGNLVQRIGEMLKPTK